MEKLASAIKRAYMKSRKWIDEVEAQFNITVDRIPTGWFYGIAGSLIVAAVGLVSTDILPPEGFFSAPNIMFLSFILIFGFIGLCHRANTRLWSALGMLVGLLMWFYSVKIAI